MRGPMMWDCTQPACTPEPLLCGQYWGLRTWEKEVEGCTAFWTVLGIVRHGRKAVEGCWKCFSKCNMEVMVVFLPEGGKWQYIRKGQHVRSSGPFFLLSWLNFQPIQGPFLARPITQQMLFSPRRKVPSLQKQDPLNQNKTCRAKQWHMTFRSKSPLYVLVRRVMGHGLSHYFATKASVA